MPKKKKTLEQKRRADKRKYALSAQEISHDNEHTIPSYSFTTPGYMLQSIQQKQTIKQDTFVLIKKDVWTTAVISTVILAIQVLLYFLLKNHVLAISFVRY